MEVFVRYVQESPGVRSGPLTAAPRSEKARSARRAKASTAARRIEARTRSHFDCGRLSLRVQRPEPFTDFPLGFGRIRTRAAASARMDRPPWSRSRNTASAATSEWG